MTTHYDLSDSEFEQRFKDCSLNPALFTHEAHLRLAWLHIQRYGVQQALENIEQQLKAFVAHVGAADKYHHTLTIAAVKAVHHFIQRSKTSDFPGFTQEFPELLTAFKKLINSHYSYDVFELETARHNYVAPDVQPFELH